MLRSLACLLMFFLGSSQASAAPCALDYGGFFDPTVIGFTYSGVKVRKTGTGKDGAVELAVTNGNATTKVTLSAGDWAAAESGCAIGKVPDGIKSKLGIPAIGIPLPALHASLDYDLGDLNGDGLDDYVKVAFPVNALIVELALTEKTLGPRVNYASGANPRSVVLGDFNGDGALDAAVAYTGAQGQNNGGVSVLIGKGDGTFQPAATYAAGGAPSSVFAADVNGDQRLDLIVTKEAGTVAVLLGAGDGAFGSATEYPVESGPESVVAADFTGDQHVDLAVANRDGNSVSLLPGNGAGGFGNAIRHEMGTAPGFLAAVDLNSDGRYDLAVLHPSSATISTWVSDGAGPLRSTGRWVTGINIGSFAVADRDNEAPLILAPDAAQTRMFIHAVQSDGSLTGEPAYVTGNVPSHFAAADFNGDGRPDLAVQGGARSILVFLGVPGGGFANAKSIALDANSTAVAAGDFNGDGKADIAVGLGNRILILNGDGAGNFLNGTTTPAGANIGFLLAFDGNNDGRLDLAALNGQNDGTVVVYRGQAGGGLQAAGPYPAGLRPVFAASADFNRDGRPDLVVANQGDGVQSGSINVYLTNADGTLAAPSTLQTGLTVGGVAAGDFTGDGIPDIAYSGLLETSPNYLFHASVQAGNGNGTFQPRITTKIDDLPGALVSADWNGDGKADLTVAHCCGGTQLSRLTGNGDGTFQVARMPGGSDTVALLAGDFNADGRQDVAILNSPGGRGNGIVWVSHTEPPAVVNTSAASNTIRQVAPESIIAAYGVDLASRVEGAASADWPEELGGARVTIRDWDGQTWAGPISYASPGQVNYLVPAGVAEGFALVTIENVSAGKSSQGLIRVGQVGPGMFFAGSSVASGVVTYVKENGEQTEASTVQVGPTGAISHRPIILGPAGETEVLALFGTGIRGRAALSDVRVTIGDVEAAVVYAGPQSEYTGLDQVNVVIPKSLRGRGIVDVVTRVMDLRANTVRIRVN